MSKVKIEIKSWFSGDVLFEYESDNATMKKKQLKQLLTITQT